MGVLCLSADVARFWTAMFQVSRLLPQVGHGINSQSPHSARMQSATSAFPSFSVETFKAGTCGTYCQDFVYVCIYIYIHVVLRGPGHQTIGS